MGGEGGRRLNSIYSSVVFREEREIEFMGRCSGQAGGRAGEPGRCLGRGGRGVGLGVFHPLAALPCLGDPEGVSGEAKVCPGMASPL